MKKRLLALTLVAVSSTILITACSKKNVVEENTHSTTEAGQAVSLKDRYHELLQTSTKVDELYAFFDENIVNATKEEADMLVNGMFGLAEKPGDLDFVRLGAHTERFSPEMRSYIGLMKDEQETPAMTDDGIQVTLADLLNRAQLFEDHLKQYDNGITSKHAYEKYNELVRAAIVGGYNGSDVKTFHYINTENFENIDSLAMDEYTKFATDHTDTITGNIVSDYVALVNENKKVLNEKVTAFFNTIDERTKAVLEVRNEQ